MDLESRYALVTGGAGFIGSNLVHRLLARGESVVVLDNLSRPKVERNVRWLRSLGGNLRIVERDCRDADAVSELVRGAHSVFHLAAQVAVTTSLENPTDDFDVNARGTLTLLEAIRSSGRPIPILFTSTNKVYGSLADVALREEPARVAPEDVAFAARGVDESRPLDFHSPYGCSKGAADQYVLDYARTYGVPAVVFRMSCIYGPHQFGTEDQGWVAHFVWRALSGAPVTIYGDGRQVRDVLFVEDLVNAFLLGRDDAALLSGTAFNVGGGPSNTTSLLELLDCIANLTGSRPEVRFEGPRLADQRYYVSDFGRFSRATGWAPTVGVNEGVGELVEWVGQQGTGLHSTPRAATRPPFWAGHDPALESEHGSRHD